MIKEKFTELKKQEIFIKDKNKGDLFLVFLLTDADLNIEQIDFNFLKNDTITCFSFKNNCWIKLKNKRKEKKYKKINLDVDIEEIYEKIVNILRTRNLFVNKYIFILENLNGKQVFNIICLCKDFYVLKVIFNTKTLDLIDEKLYNLMNFFRVG